jgi:hypothetical protein
MGPSRDVRGARSGRRWVRDSGLDTGALTGAPIDTKGRSIARMFESCGCDRPGRAELSRRSGWCVVGTALIGGHDLVPSGCP